jgi:hypothetical protein
MGRDPDVGAGALARVHAARARGEHPVALLDVDLTLIENAPRTRAVILDWLATVDDARSETARAHLSGMPLEFSIRKNLAAAIAVLDRSGDAGLMSDGIAFWKRAFFDPAYLVHDVALDGAVEAVARLRDAGATVVYLTARLPSQAAGTVERMRALGFPIAEPGALLVARGDAGGSDEAAKVGALEWCGRLGRVVLTAENEPSHANAMRRAFPEALTVLVATRHSTPAPEPAAGVVPVARLVDAL